MMHRSLLLKILCLFFLLTSRSFASFHSDSVRILVSDSLYISIVGVSESEVPKYPGSYEQLMSDLQSAIVYPPKSAQKGLEGIVTVRIGVDPNRGITDSLILSAPDQAMGKEALRAIKSLSFFRDMAAYGARTKLYYTLPVVFHLKGDEIEAYSDFTGTPLSFTPPSFITDTIYHLLDTKILSHQPFPEGYTPKHHKEWVFVDAVIDENGDKIRVRATTESADPLLKRAAEEAVRNIGKDRPATRKGKPIKVGMSYCVTFLKDLSRFYERYPEFEKVKEFHRNNNKKEGSRQEGGEN